MLPPRLTVSRLELKSALRSKGSSYASAAEGPSLPAVAAVGGRSIWAASVDAEHMAPTAKSAARILRLLVIYISGFLGFESYVQMIIQMPFHSVDRPYARRTGRSRTGRRAVGLAFSWAPIPHPPKH